MKQSTLKCFENKLASLFSPLAWPQLCRVWIKKKKERKQPNTFLSSVLIQRAYYEEKNKLWLFLISFLFPQNVDLYRLLSKLREIHMINMLTPFFFFFCQGFSLWNVHAWSQHIKKHKSSSSKSNWWTKQNSLW